MHTGVTIVFAFSKISFDPISSIKLLSTKIEEMFPLSMVRFYPGRACQHLCPLEIYQLRQLRRLYSTNISIAPVQVMMIILAKQLMLVIQRKNGVASYHPYFSKIVKEENETQLMMMVTPKWWSFWQLKK